MILQICFQYTRNIILLCIKFLNKIINLFILRLKHESHIISYNIRFINFHLVFFF